MFQFKISLKDITPPIWRQVLVSEGLSFGDFHKVIQKLFSWKDYHQHEFYKGQPSKDNAIGDRLSLDKHFTAAGRLATYLYDFGDNWELEVVLEEVVEAADAANSPVCLGGANAGPPEDCGGVGGYEELLSALRDKAHPEHETMKEWVGGDFDPKRFEIEQINQELKLLTLSKK